MKDKRIAVIGCGNLGFSIVNGLLSLKDIEPKNIIATKRNTSSIGFLAETGVQITSDNQSAIEKSEVIIVALKPYNILSVLQELKHVFKPNQHILISLATGIHLQDLENVLGNELPIFRAMPNTAADVSTSMTCIASKSGNQEQLELVKQCFNAIGTSIVIEEDLMDAATVLGACGIAYVLRFMRAMVQGGIQIGFSAEVANQIVNQTVKGAATLLSDNKEHPEFEIDKVTTPKGCTIAGLNEMEHNGFSSALIKGIVTSFKAIER